MKKIKIKLYPYILIEFSNNKYYLNLGFEIRTLFYKFIWNVLKINSLQNQIKCGATGNEKQDLCTFCEKFSQNLLEEVIELIENEDDKQKICAYSHDLQKNCFYMDFMEYILF